MASQFLLIAFIAITASVAFASDPSSLQDFCVAEPKSSGWLCSWNHNRSYVFDIITHIMQLVFLLYESLTS